MKILQTLEKVWLVLLIVGYPGQGAIGAEQFRPPDKSECIKHGGTWIDKGEDYCPAISRSICASEPELLVKPLTGSCKADWKEATAICNEGGRRLINRYEAINAISSCGGDPGSVITIYEKNKRNKKYQSCYKKAGFSANYYWTSTAAKHSSSFVVVVDFDDGSVFDVDKTASRFVQCR